MIGLATITYLLLFQCAAIPAIVRVIRRGSSRDLSVWREWLILSGICVQLSVMWATGAHVYVWLGPVASFTSMSVLLACIYRHR